MSHPTYLGEPTTATNATLAANQVAGQLRLIIALTGQQPWREPLRPDVAELANRQVQNTCREFNTFIEFVGGPEKTITIRAKDEGGNTAFVDYPYKEGDHRIFD